MYSNPEKQEIFDFRCFSRILEFVSMPPQADAQIRDLAELHPETVWVWVWVWVWGEGVSVVKSGESVSVI